jgi:hypothetical protein
MVDLPLCREQFKRMRSELERRRSSCQGSGSTPTERAKLTRSKASLKSLARL